MPRLSAVGISGIHAGEDVKTYPLSNVELAAAIKYAFERYIYALHEREPVSEIMLAHLKELLSVQIARAQLVVDNNNLRAGTKNA